MGDILTKYDCILILVDFNIHDCCAANALAKDFLNLISSLNFVQWVNGPTHSLGHTLDLILTYGLSVSDVVTSDTKYFLDKVKNARVQLSTISDSIPGPILSILNYSLFTHM